MKQIIDITIPKGWHELSNKQLRFVYRLLGGNYSLPQVKTKCLIKWSGMEVIRREGAIGSLSLASKGIFDNFLLKFLKKVIPIRISSKFPVF